MLQKAVATYLLIRALRNPSSLMQTLAAPGTIVSSDCFINSDVRVWTFLPCRME